jgi:hypothetical protein
LISAKIAAMPSLTVAAGFIDASARASFDERGLADRNVLRGLSGYFLGMIQCHESDDTAR